MLTAHSKQGENCFAWQVCKSDGPFYCKNCHAEVNLKKGPIRQHHFAHFPPNVCAFGQGESEIHYKAKRIIFEQLSKSSNCSFCALEYKIEDFIPDIYVVINKIPVEIISKSNSDRS